jgi:UDP-N-acetylglucosamine--N-acetylmuramyl-(pentapeptide) pyrophosphoryl-undecaprenol N-acetylglucosamine transferase
MKSKRPILFTGGGTLGPVTPLLAIYEVWREQDPGMAFAWVGTPSGPEAELVHSRRIPFYTLRVPKLNRHQKWQWPLVPFGLAWSFVRSVKLLRKLKPQMIFTAGGYVSVPLAWAGRMMGIPVWVHQLDVIPGVANKLMAPAAERVSVTFEASLKDYGHDKTLVVGGVTRDSVGKGDPKKAMEEFGLNPRKPTLFVLGGGTGATQINDAMAVIGKELERKMNIIHLTGKGKTDKRLEKIGGNYAVREFLNTQMADAYAAADAVVARAGMGTLLEIAMLRKPALLIPIAGSHQIANARAFEDADAAEVVYRVNPQILKQQIEHLILDESRKAEIKQHLKRFLPHNGAEEIVHSARRILHHRA